MSNYYQTSSVRPAAPRAPTFLESLDLVIVTAQAAWEDSKQAGGRPRGRASKRNESGDAYFLGVVGGLREARVIFNRIESGRPSGPRAGAAGMLCKGGA